MLPGAEGAVGPALAVNHVEFYVEDAAARAADLVEGHGFEAVAGATDSGRRSDVLCQGSIVLVLTEPRSPRHPAHAYLAAHGDGVADIALRTPDAARAFESAVAGGARALSAPSAAEDSAGSAGVLAAIEAFGDVRHSLVQPPAGFAGTAWLPWFGSVGTSPRARGIGLRAVDHFAVLVPPGDLAATVAHYETALGFSAVFEERIQVGAQAMDSKVVHSGPGGVTFTLIEPDPAAARGQIDAFLAGHGGAGVQHIAFSCADSVATVGEMARRGVEFLATPERYYQALASRITPAAHSIAELQDLNILLDEDHDGQLFQIFTRSTHPRRTFFWEVIERLGARTFGSGNIKALYEAVAAEQTSVPAPS